MGNRKKFLKSGTLRTSIIITAVIAIVGAALSFSMYSVIEKSFFKAAVIHEMGLMRIMESLGSQLIDSKLHDLKMDAQNVASQYEVALSSGEDEQKAEILSSIELKDYQLNYCYQTREALYCGEQFHGDFAARLDLSGAWEGNTVLFSPDFDREGNYILALAVPVWQNQQEGEIDGILIEQLDGFYISEWISDLFLSLDFGTAYIVDGSGRNIATAREENFDWITMRYNAQELVKGNDDESTKSIAKLERNALEGKSGIDTYVWEGSKNYVAYGPLTEADWGFYVGFYGDKFEKYTQDITSISSRAAIVMLVTFALFLGAIILVVMRNLSKERRLNEMLVQQKEEIEQQALRIAASEERFRIAMQRSRDIIIEYQLETGEITCFYESREIKSGSLGDDELRKRVLGECFIDEDSFERFEEVLRAISRGLTSAECLIGGDCGGVRRWYSLSVSAIPNGTQMSTRAVGILRDVTGEREAELDSLTRLLNKAAMTNAVTDAMQKNKPDTASAFVMMDVDHFKLINDKYGHPVGDEVLCRVSDCLREVFPVPYLTGRVGGDEFSIYCPSNADLKEIENRLKRLATQVREMQVNCESLRISISIGAVLFHGKAQFEEIYKKTDEMLYEIKAAGRDGWRIFEKR